MIETSNAADCGSYAFHGPHTYREGFFWHEKKSCRGSYFPDIPDDFEPPNAALVPMPIIPQHKHFFQLKEAYSFGPKLDTDILWGCDCRYYFVTDRDLWWTKGVWYDIK
jgi:hypothetical protein